MNHENFIVKPGKKIRLKDYDPAFTAHYKNKEKGNEMKTSVMEVHDMLEVFSVDEVEKRIGEVPGVQSVTVNHAEKNATVRFDETRLEITDIKSAVRQRGYDSATPAAAAPIPPAGGHEGHTPPSTPAAAGTPAAPKPPAPASSKPTGSAEKDKAKPDEKPPAKMDSKPDPKTE